MSKDNDKPTFTPECKFCEVEVADERCDECTFKKESERRTHEDDQFHEARDEGRA